MPVVIAIIYSRIQGETMALQSQCNSLQQNQDVAPHTFQDSFQVWAPKLHCHYSHSFVWVVWVY